MTTIYFIRHAKPDYTIHDDLIRPLTEQGKADAEGLVEVFRDIHIDLFVSSPYLRAVDTITPLAKAQDKPIHRIEGFKERKISEGKWIEDFNSYAKHQWSDFDYSLCGGESLRIVQNRNIKALEQVLKDHKGETVVVGSHGTALSTIINYYEPQFGYEDFHKIKGKMPWIVRFEFEDGVNSHPHISW